MLLMLLSLMKLQWNYSSVPGTKGIYIYIFFYYFTIVHTKVHVQKSIRLNKLSGIECPHVISTQIKKQNITRILGDLPVLPSKHHPLPDRQLLS